MKPGTDLDSFWAIQTGKIAHNVYDSAWEHLLVVGIPFTRKNFRYCQ